MAEWLLALNLSLKTIIKKDNEGIQRTFLFPETGAQPASDLPDEQNTLGNLDCCLGGPSLRSRLQAV